MTAAKSSENAVYKVINIITTVVLAVLVIFAALLTVPKMAGMDTYVVLSGSMEPAYKTGSLIYTKKIVDTAELKIDDVITFRLNDSTVATHRIVDVSTADGAYVFQTKGDANASPDPNPVPEENVVGKVIFSVPYLGYAADFVQHPPGIYIAVMLGVVLLLLTYISDRRKPRKE